MQTHRLRRDISRSGGLRHVTRMRTPPDVLRGTFGGKEWRDAEMALAGPLTKLDVSPNVNRRGDTVSDCIRCGDTPAVDEEGYCGHCHWAARAEAEQGLYQLREYLKGLSAPPSEDAGSGT
jgi:hypothetical protein